MPMLRRRPAFAAQFCDDSAAAAVGGFDTLESRAMLAANDMFVSLVGNQVVLTLDQAGAAIADLRTSYSATKNVLTIRAATMETIATQTSGITVDNVNDTIVVELKKTRPSPVSRSWAARTPTRSRSARVA